MPRTDGPAVSQPLPGDAPMRVSSGDLPRPEYEPSSTGDARSSRASHTSRKATADPDSDRPRPSWLLARARFARRATLRRSLRLLGSFRHEQTDPAKFYGTLAHDSAQMLADFYIETTGRELTGATVVDVGGGPGYFADEFAATGARYLPVEPDPSELHAAGISATGAVRGSGMGLPLRDNAVDICFSSNVAEHVPQPWVMAEEMVRVTRPGGLIVLSYTVWSGPFGGHETGPWHYFGGEYAARRYRRKYGHEPKNRFGVSLFAVRAADGLQWAARTSARVHLVFPRYHPHWAWWLVRVPLIRELFVSNLVVIASKPE